MRETLLFVRVCADFRPEWTNNIQRMTTKCGETEQNARCAPVLLFKFVLKSYGGTLIFFSVRFDRNLMANWMEVWNIFPNLSDLSFSFFPLLFFLFGCVGLMRLEWKIVSLIGEREARAWTGKCGASAWERRRERGRECESAAHIGIGRTAACNVGEREWRPCVGV